MQTNPPTIISRSSHNISRSMISPNALRVMYRLRDNGFMACLVGGSVRDLLIGKTPKDFDIATDATPSELKKLFRNCRLIGRRFRLAHLHFRDEIIEVATFRAGGDAVEPDEPEEGEADTEGGGDGQRPVMGELHKSEDGMLLRDNLFGTPEEDAWRRDFTVNALSYDITRFAVIDYVGGMEDLEQRLIRTIGDPGTRFAEDPVRMLRAIRLSAQLGFTIEHHSLEAMIAHARRITLASPARLFDEVVKLLLSGASEQCWRLLCECGIAPVLLPQYCQWLKEQDIAAPPGVLPWLDRMVLDGRAVSTQLLLALFFSGYVFEKEERFAGTESAWQARIDRALAEMMQEFGGVLAIPQRTVMKLREILLLQQRMRKIPGRKPENVIARPGFLDALAYLQFRQDGRPELAKAAGWWERLSAGEVRADAARQPLPDESGGRSGTGRRRRRRKKRRKPVQGEG